MKLNNWFIVNNRAYGNVEGNPNFEDEGFVRTSEIVERNDTHITTKSGSVYDLGTSYVQSMQGEEID